MSPFSRLLDQNLTTTLFRRFFVAKPENKKARRAGLLLVELAGLEPATSWVRFTRGASPPFAIVHRLSQPSGFRRNALTAVRRASPPLLDQNLTTADRGRGLAVLSWLILGSCLQHG